MPRTTTAPCPAHDTGPTAPVAAAPGAPAAAHVRGPASLLATAALVLATAAGTIGVTWAAPASADVASDIAASQAQLDGLNAQAEAAAERYDKGRIDLATAQQDADAARAALARQDAEVAALRVQAAGFAAQAYRNGGSVTKLTLWTSPGSAQSILSGLSSLDAVAHNQGDILSDLRTARARQQLAAAVAQRAADNAEATVSTLESERRAVVDAAATAQQVLAGLQAQQAQLAQSARTVADRQAAHQAAVALAGQAGNAAASLTAFRAQPSAPAVPVVPAGSVPGSQAAMVAVHTALAQLGKPYVYGAAGPNSFDCSGLTMYAYAAAGIALPHYTGAQMGIGRRVGLGELAPGDLVFFSGHVAMYIGNGTLVHAPHSGDVVRTVALAGYWQSQIIAITRPAG